MSRTESGAGLTVDRILSASALSAAVSLQDRALTNFTRQEFCFDFGDQDANQDKELYSRAIEFQPNGWLSLEVITRLVGGEEIRMDHPEIKPAISGTIRWLWWQPGRDNRWNLNIVVPLLEFLPDEAVMTGKSFSDWKALRFPTVPGSCTPPCEDFLVGLHALWRQETCPPAVIQPDDELLYQACVENYERLVAAILEGRRVEMEPYRVREVTETALGVAMENQGIFGEGPGFMSGCHRRYREDDFAEAEDPKTWVPRAKRIEQMLREAGALDYSPIIEACREGAVEEVRRLLDAGYPPNFAVYGCSTPLCEAVGRKDAVLCRLLLDRGANPNLPRPFDAHMTYGGAVYPLAISLDNPEILGMLLVSCPTNKGMFAGRNFCDFQGASDAPVWGHTGRASNAAATSVARPGFPNRKNPSGPWGCDENGPAPALLLTHVSQRICSFAAPWRRAILIATNIPLFVGQDTRCRCGPRPMR